LKSITKEKTRPSKRTIMATRSSSIATHVSYDSKSETIIQDDVEIYTENFGRMGQLWKRREDFDFFIVLGSLHDSMAGLPSLKEYCLANQRFLMVDTHVCLEPNCKDHTIQTIVELVIEPERSIAMPKKVDEVSISIDKDPEGKIVPNVEHKIIHLEPVFYEQLLTMAKMDLSSVSHEGVIVVFDGTDLTSLYGNIKYLPVE